MQFLPFVVNSLMVERPHDRPVAEPAAELYVSQDGIVCMCSYCRRTMQTGEPDQWDWVPAFVTERPPRVSHGFCRICAEYYLN